MAARILVIEEDEARAAGLLSLLEAGGYRVTALPSGGPAPWQGTADGTTTVVVTAGDWPTDASDQLLSGDLRIDLAGRVVFRGTRALPVGPTEFRLLEVFARNPGRILSRPALVACAWPSGAVVNERTVDVHVGRLRRVLRRSRDPDPIRTVRGAGYCYRPRPVRLEASGRMAPATNGRRSSLQPSTPTSRWRARSNQDSIISMTHERLK